MKKQRMIAIFFSVALLLCCAVILSLSKEAFAFTLPDTGQTKCYGTADTEIACTGTGQDGYYNINPMSYTDNGNGTITDNVTGLVWQKGENAIYYNWYVASGTSDATYNLSSQNVCGSLTIGGQSGWRLPTKKELITLVDYSIPHPGPTINTTYFPNAYWSSYWSSTTYADYTFYAWPVDFSAGVVTDHGKSANGFVRCVRGGQSSPSFTDNGNGTVTDNGTGLIWQQGEPGTIMTWANALTYCEGLSLGAQSDWRLPNVKELESITDDTTANPTIDRIYFPNAYGGTYWSSTTGAGNTGLPSTTAGYAWCVGFDYGGVGYGDKSGDYSVRCVRDGQSAPLCSFTISPSSNTFTSTGGTGTVTVTASGTSCAWTATSTLNWVTITSGSSGTGSGTATFTVGANTTGAERTGNITIAGQTFTLTQAAASTTCTYTISPASEYFTSASGRSNITVTASGSSCAAWTAVSNNTDWIRVVSGATGTGSGTVTISWSANTTGASRTATITIAGQTATITQSDTVSICTYTVSPTSQTFTSASNTGSVTVTASENSCSWTATSSLSWAAITSGASGTGNGTVAISVSANTTGAERTGNITIAGQTVTITQAAASTTCTYTISPTSLTFTATSNTGSVTVTASANSCAWTATSSLSLSWAAITNGSSGIGNGTVYLLVAANTTGAERTDNITIAGQTVVITQSADGTVYLVITTPRTSYTSYSTIQAAYNANTSTSGSSIYVQGLTFAETLLFDQNNSITLTGGCGYDSIFTTIGATMTTVSGSLTISGGTVTVANIVIQ